MNKLLATVHTLPNALLHFFQFGVMVSLDGDFLWVHCKLGSTYGHFAQLRVMIIVYQRQSHRSDSNQGSDYLAIFFLMSDF